MIAVVLLVAIVGQEGFVVFLGIQQLLGFFGRHLSGWSLLLLLLLVGLFFLTALLIFLLLRLLFLLLVLLLLLLLLILLLLVLFRLRLALLGLILFLLLLLLALLLLLLLEQFIQLLQFDVVRKQLQSLIYFLPRPGGVVGQIGLRAAVKKIIGGFGASLLQREGAEANAE